MKVIYIKYSDLYSPLVMKLISTNPHLAYTRYDLLSVPSEEIPKIKPIDIYDSEEVEDFEEGYEDNEYIICRILITDTVADQIKELGIDCIFTHVGKQMIDQFILLNQGNTQVLHQEILNIAVADNTDQKLIDYVWSYFAMPSHKKDYIKFLKTAVRDSHIQLNHELNEAKERFIETNRTKCKKWLRGILDDRDEIIKAIRRIDPGNRSSFFKHSLIDLQSHLVETFLTIVFYEGIKGNVSENGIDRLIKSMK